MACGSGGDGGQVGTDGMNTGCSFSQGIGGTANAGGAGGTNASPGVLGDGGATIQASSNGGGGGGGYYGGKETEIRTCVFCVS
jgi:hypothetical protein